MWRKRMTCTITNPTETTTIPDVYQVTVPVPTGVIVVRAGHAEYYGRTVSGEVVIITTTEEEKRVSVAAGICTVADDQVTIIV